MLNKFSPRAPFDRIRLRVWRWEKSTSDAHLTVLNRVTAYVEIAWRAGLCPDEIIDDICEKFPSLFEDGELDHDERTNTIFICLVPCDQHSAAGRG